ncbi:hypothetical protein HMPREF9943_01061 [Eggerthia catenaformis OT 569 = DSM 20559]|uniref:Uncharacterized protein n=1 Tax=Eggerthia catenaformis OT 569 = DSM 20559 TaxID=999415 RepID=M2P869_9FIRM|nr:hypothetical protein [Eggerthia catenaformis]EMD16507.1 hypothetical protein HMPREF9943_01061 [Eggerthia catenaformis OT 569 = DSM 20559]
MIKGDLENISNYLKDLKFKKKLINGIDEEDVWHKLDLLEKEYEKAYQSLLDKSNALLEEKDATIERLLKK